MKAILQLHEKKAFKNGMVLEIKLWEVARNKRYPDGIRYSLLFIDPPTGKKILMDNHTPKGHHYHINDKEHEYTYADINKLIKDFKAFVKTHMGVTL